LEELDCSSNPLIDLDLSANTALRSLYCVYNQLSVLDIRANTELTSLGCYNNQLKSLDLSANTKLRWLSCPHNQITDLDLSTNTELRTLYCNDNQLTVLDLRFNTAFEEYDWIDCSDNRLTTLYLPVLKLGYLYCYNNHLQLSDLFTATQNVTLRGNSYKQLGPQTLGPQVIAIGSPIDYSDQYEFDGTTTVFAVTKNSNPAIVNVDYTEISGIITFNTAGIYTITMTNAAILERKGGTAAEMVVEFTVIGTNTDATLSNLAVSEGELAPVFGRETLSYTVDVAHEVSSITITAIPTDPNATVSGDGTFSLGDDNIFTITVTAEDGVTKLDYIVTVIRTNNVDITEIVQRSKIYPNPTNGIIYTETESNIKVYDQQGVLLWKKMGNSIDLSAYPQGIYILQVNGEWSKIVKK